MTTNAVDHLAEPHHDTGPSYLRGERAPGAELTARLWVPAAHDPQRVVLRQVVDGEPAITMMERVALTPAGAWWHGTVRLVNPVNRYRFLLLSPDGPEPYLWYHAAGLSDHDVPDATDFQVLAEDPAPEWVHDAVCYQIFPDRFAYREPAAQRHAPPWAVRRDWLDEPPVRGRQTSTSWYGGDLEGIIDHLDWLERLHVTVVYLTPVFPAASVHRYDATSFDRVDPLLGGTAALARLAQALHARGMRLVLDLTTNHTGVTHEWFTAACADAQCEEAGFYHFERHPDHYASWFDVPELPKLDHRSPELRDRLVRGPSSVTARWLAPPVGADGWRTDVANMTGRHSQVDLAHQVAADMRATMRQVEEGTGRRLWLVAEHGHDASGDLTGPGWHGTMNYVGFTRPLWAWLADPDPADGLTWLGIPMPVPRLGAAQVVAGVRQYTAHLPPSAVAASMNLLCSHDTPRVRTVVRSRERQLLAATALFTAPGVPTVFAGDELGATGITGEHSRTTMPWAVGEDGAPRADEVADTGAWGPVDRVVLERYRHLAGLRASTAALRHGGLRWVHAEGDVVAWLRTHPDGDVLVVLARSAADALDLPLTALGAGGVARLECFDAVSAALLPGSPEEAGPGAGRLVVTPAGCGALVAVLRPEPAPGEPAPQPSTGEPLS
ncbi:MAG: alpha-amylase family glycosyl hydrolase [Actinomyces sp.]|uniref:alpha-amylase family glycosyl hydrolase n=1 Tax=Actinomyces sp. TaxID=29317 RepID=UPI0026DB0849|nr:alpha-amylase family glycosyl hydrolase [Actinomyces sp.]MDO4243004.1 alpha-amylase family glycosyl hydrolase [Actinomyces sp.]